MPAFTVKSLYFIINFLIFKYKKGPLKEVASVILLALMLGGTYTHYALKDSFERMAPSLVFALLIVCRLVILKQVNKRERKELEEIKKLIENQSEEKEEITETSIDSDEKKDK